MTIPNSRTAEALLDTSQRSGRTYYLTNESTKYLFWRAQQAHKKLKTICRCPRTLNVITYTYIGIGNQKELFLHSFIPSIGTKNLCTYVRIYTHMSSFIYLRSYIRFLHTNLNTSPILCTVQLLKFDLRGIFFLFFNNSAVYLFFIFNLIFASEISLVLYYGSESYVRLYL